MGLSLSAGLVSACLPVSYVLLVHVFDRNGTDRNDPDSIQRRFRGAFLSNLISIAVTAYYLLEYTNSPLLEMGIRWDNISQSIVFPFVLMHSFYFGQFVMMYIDRTLWHYLDSYEWKTCWNSWVWRRDILVGPLTEEIVFRCCSSTLMAHIWGAPLTILLNPIPFAASHFHHIWDDQRKGYSLAHSILQRGFQFCYTYVFGMFATYLQLTTRHAVVPIIAHSICNAQGLPLWMEIANYPKRRDRWTLYLAYGAGFSAFVYLLWSQKGMPRP
ncbi:unnamed protein product [Caenorhabditis sp. 36 PRJEB53466]|nr:unnamed protein product [Caenorhabditis sp. 36 PRJEB53466]